MNGIFYDMPEHLYRSAPAVSQSSLKAIARSPAHFRAGVEDGDREDTRDMLLGRLVATLILEPDRQTWWTVKPENIKLNETEGREWAKRILNWNEEVDGKFPKAAKEAFEKRCVTIISFEDFQTASRMAGAIFESKKPEVRDIFSNSRHEVSVFAQIETDYGMVNCKSRPDIECVGSNALVDLKSCLDARPDAFNKSVRRYGYHIQGYSYLAQWNSIRPSDKEVFILLAVEKSPPYACIVHQLESDWLEEGRQEYMDMLSLYQRCTQANSWPDYPEGINKLSMPSRFYNRID